MIKYYIFKVKDAIGQIYYIVQNRYIGYIGFDSQHTRSIIEYSVKSKTKAKDKYFLIAVSDKESSDLHKYFCENQRFTELEIKEIINKYFFTTINDPNPYLVYYPEKNCSKSWLRCERNGKEIRDGSLPRRFFSKKES